jgi:hypothetical protein
LWNSVRNHWLLERSSQHIFRTPFSTSRWIVSQLSCSVPSCLYWILLETSPPSSKHRLPACGLSLASRCIILTSLIRNVLSPDNIHHALALLHIPKTQAGADYLDLEEVKTIVDQYLQSNSWNLPRDLPSIVSLARLTARVFRFVNKFFESAMETLSTFHPLDGSWPLSPTERARL